MKITVSPLVEKMDAIVYFGKERKRFLQLDDRQLTILEEHMVEDGFGNSHSIMCQACYLPGVYVVRPGKFGCYFCESMPDDMLADWLDKYENEVDY